MSPASPPAPGQVRVAAYCRVSTDREDQANSLRSQRSYFQSYIQSRPGWVPAGIYADEGISGTSVRRREAFARMIGDAREGKLDLILTKEVSRFARNTVDALEYTRSLKAMGVGVLFLNDGIDTRSGDGELRLTIMASMAQEESRKTSERVRWGQKRRMEAGVVFGCDNLYGFRLSGGVLSVREDQAQIVRRIYRKFLHEGKGTHVIARELWEEGIPPPRSATGRWSAVMIHRLLRNEKYVGDLLQKKYITRDYLTHRKIENRGQEEQIYLRDHHEAIVDRPTWDAVQAELDRRRDLAGEKGRYSGRHWCSGKILCGTCGSRFVLKQTTRPNGQIYRVWGCHRRTEHGAGACGMRMVNDKVLLFCVGFVLEAIGVDFAAVLRELRSDLRQCPEPDHPESLSARLKERKAALEQKKLGVMDLFLDGSLSREEMTGLKERYDREMAALDRQLSQVPPPSSPSDALPDPDALLPSAAGSPHVCGQVLSSITVFPDCLLLRLRDVPGQFRLFPAASGRGEGYTVTVPRWEYVPASEEQ